VMKRGCVVALMGLAAACGPVGGRDAGGSSGTADAGGGGGVTFSFGAPEPVSGQDPAGSGGLGLAVNSAGEIAVTYLVELTTTQTCVTPFTPARELPESGLRLARSSMVDEWTDVVLYEPRSPVGSHCTYNSNGNLHVVFAGGDQGTGECGSSDLMEAVVAPGAMTGTVTTLAADGNTSRTCRTIQNACNVGNVVGGFPWISFAADGRKLVATQDRHFGFAAQVDREGTDLEVLIDGAITTVDDTSGSGWFNQIFEANGMPSVVHVQIKDWDWGAMGGSKAKGVWFTQQQMDGTWRDVMVDGTTVPDSQISAAWHPTLGYAVAYHEPDVDDDLWVATSPDGLTWTKERVANLGRVGRTPSIAWSRDTLIVAYGACNGPTDTGGNCQPARDGVRLSIKDAGVWRTQTVYNSEEFLEGTDVRMVVDANGNPIIAFKSQGTRRVLVVRGRRS
jgi:hypothetical protein